MSELATLTPDDLAFLEECRVSAARIAAHRHTPPRWGPLTVEEIQGLYDAGVVGAILEGDYWEAVGVALGDELARQFGLQWQAVSDEYGEALVVALPGKMLYASPIDMVIKRVEQGETLDLEDLLIGFGEMVAEIIASGEAGDRA